MDSDSDIFKDLAASLRDLDLNSAVEKIQDFLEQIDNVQLNIAVTGETGSGKSTFINAIRDLHDDDPGSAPTGVVETTKDPTAYTHPDYPNITWWDLPGIESPTFKANQYLVNVQFERYDFFIIVAAQRFRACHGQLAKEIKNMNKNFYFLRNKIDVDIKAEKRKREFDETSVLQTIRQNCIKELEKINVAAVEVFLISCHELALFDFNLLLNNIQNDLPDMKRYVLLLALPNITMEILKKKKKALHSRIWMISLLSGAVAAVPVPVLSFAVDAAILLSEIKIYRKAFDIDDESLQRLAEASGVPVEELKAEIKHSLHVPRSLPEVLDLLVTTSQFALLKTSGEIAAGLIPIVGSLLSSGISFATTFYMLRKCLNDLSTDANNVLLKALNSAAERK